MTPKDLSELGKLPLVVEVLRSLATKQQDRNHGFLLEIAADATAQVFEHFRDLVIGIEQDDSGQEPIPDSRLLH